MKRKNNIRLFREIKGYSQGYVAKHIGKSQAALSKIENGYINLSDEFTDQISEILEVPKHKLFDDEKSLVEPLSGITSLLIDELKENKKLLLKVELNQEKLQQQLNVLFSKLIETNR